MRTCKRTEGQTIIETALMLTLLLLILLGITEFSRAWFTKSSLKNGVRSGARVAVVTTGLSLADNGYSDQCAGNPCPTNPANADGIRDVVCCSPGVRNNSLTTVSLTITDDDSNSNLNSGDTILVSGSTTFDFVIGGYRFSFMGLRIWPWPNSISMTTDASMRYE